MIKFKNYLMGIVFCSAASLFLTVGNASALSLSFDYEGINYGSVEILQKDTNIFSFDYPAAATLPGSAEATGFGFGPYLGDFIVSNPLDGNFTYDENDLNWKKFAGDPNFPQPTNSSLSKDLFKFAATEEENNNFTPPGILAGQRDVFYLGFNEKVSIEDLLYVGVRIQSLPDDINGGSLFLVGDTPPNPVPEPATMLLFGVGLAGLASVRRKK